VVLVVSKLTRMLFSSRRGLTRAVTCPLKLSIITRAVLLSTIFLASPHKAQLWKSKTRMTAFFLDLFHSDSQQRKPSLAAAITISGGFKGGEGVQMHPPLAASYVFLRTYLH